MWTTKTTKTTKTSQPGVVVGAGTQDVTQRVPGQTPDHSLMSHFHPPHLLLHPDGVNTQQQRHETNVEHKETAERTRRTQNITPCARRAGIHQNHHWQKDLHGPGARPQLRTQKRETSECTSQPAAMMSQLVVMSLTSGLLLVSSENLQLLLQVPDVKEFTQVVT